MTQRKNYYDDVLMEMEKKTATVTFNSIENDVAVNPKNCMCYQCSELITKSCDCACDIVPDYYEPACSQCKHNKYCAVALNPFEYPKYLNIQ